MKNYFWLRLAIVTILFFSNFVPALASRGISQIEVSRTAGRIYNLSFYEVDRQMKLLARTAENEDSWLYVEERGKLYDIGYDGNRLSSNNTTERFYKDKTVLRNVSTVGIHNHPMMKGDKNIYPPSFQDIYFLASCKYRFKKDFGASFRGVIYDGTGVWRYDMTDRVAELFQDKKTREEIQKKLRYLRYIFHLKDPRYKTRASAISKYILEVSKLGILMDYSDI